MGQSWGHGRNAWNGSDVENQYHMIYTSILCHGRRNVVANVTGNSSVFPLGQLFFSTLLGETHLGDSAVFPTYPVSTLLSNLFYSYDLDQATKMTSRTPAL